MENLLRLNKEMDKLEKENIKIIDEMHKLFDKESKFYHTVGNVEDAVETGVLIAPGVAVVAKINFFKAVVIKKINTELKHLQKLESALK